MILLGAMLSVGDGVEMDIQKSESWFLRASIAGSVEGTYRLGLLYGREGEWDKAITAFRSCVARDFVPAMNKLGLLYLNGRIGKPDPEQAKALWETASALGQLPARRNLGVLLMSGRYGLWAMARGARLIASAFWGAVKLADPNRPSDLLRS